jgi:hypothetical protein
LTQLGLGFSGRVFRVLNSRTRTRPDFVGYPKIRVLKKSGLGSGNLQLPDLTVNKMYRQ